MIQLFNDQYLFCCVLLLPGGSSGSLPFAWLRFFLLVLGGAALAALNASSTNFHCCDWGFYLDQCCSIACSGKRSRLRLLAMIFVALLKPAPGKLRRSCCLRWSDCCSVISAYLPHELLLCCPHVSLHRSAMTLHASLRSTLTSSAVLLLAAYRSKHKKLSYELALISSLERLAD